jgi:hypothetical protein
VAGQTAATMSEPDVAIRVEGLTKRYGAVGFAKPGMPADGEILVEGSGWPARPTRR